MVFGLLLCTHLPMQRSFLSRICAPVAVILRGTQASETEFQHLELQELEQRVLYDASPLGVLADIGSSQFDEPENDIFSPPVAMATSSAAGPTQSVPGAQTVAEDLVLTFGTVTGNAITVADNIATEDPMLQVTLSVSNGYLELQQTTGLTFIQNQNGDRVFVILGTKTDINAALENLRYTPESNFSGNVNFNLTTELAGELKVHYEFDSDASDSSLGASHDGLLNGDATTTQDVDRGNVLSLDGSNDYITVGSEFDQPSNVTLAAWVKFSSSANSGGEVISIADAISIRLDDPLFGVGAQYDHGSGVSIINADPGSSLADDTWHHIALTFDDDGNTQRLYIDGMIAATTNYSESINYSGLHPWTTIGAHGPLINSSLDFEGRIDDVRIYSRALSPNEVSLLATDSDSTTDTISISVRPYNDAPTYHNGSGLVLVDFVNAGNDNQFTDVLGLPNGKYMAIGEGDNGSGNDVVVNRFNKDGTPDGMIIVDFGSTNDFGVRIEPQNDGKFLIFGQTDDSTVDIVIARAFENGGLDPSFGTNGIATFDSGGVDIVSDIKVLPNGKIVVVGQVDDDGLMLQYNANGTLDNSFGGGDGILTTELGGNDKFTTVGVQFDGKLVISGSSTFNGNSNWFVRRYLSDGKLDTDFASVSGFGTNFTSFEGYDDAFPTDLVLAEDDSILVGGFVNHASGGAVAVAKYDAHGDLDTSFGSGGLAVHDFGIGFEDVGGIARQADGKILLAGSSNGRSLASVFRLNADGAVDTSFGTLGEVQVAPGTDLNHFNSVIVRDNTIIAVGGTTSTGNTDAIIAAFNSDGSAKNQFNSINTLDGNPTFVEGGPAVTLSPNVEIYDEELSGIDDFGGATLTLFRNGGSNPNDVFSANGDVVFNAGVVEIRSANVGTYSQSNGTLVLTFTSGVTNAQVNEVMQSLEYSNLSDAPPPSVLIDWIFDDRNGSTQGFGGAMRATGSTLVNIIAVNDTPFIHAPLEPYTVDEQTNLTIEGTGFSITDPDAGDGNLWMTILSGEGNITVLAGDSGAAVTQGNGTNFVTIEGTLAALNSLLTGSSTGTVTFYNSNDNPVFPTTLSITVSDRGNTGVDPGLTGDGSHERYEASQSIFTTAINNDPTNAGSLPATVEVIEDIPTGVDLSAIHLQDFDIMFGELTLTLTTATGGGLTAPSHTGITVGGAPDALTLTGSTFNLNTYLNDHTITYLHGNPNTAGNHADAITIFVNDNGNSGLGGGTDQNLGSISINILPVNDAPTANDVVATGSENATSIQVTLSGSDIDGTVQSFSVHGVPGNGTLYLNPGLTNIVTPATDLLAVNEELTLYYVPDPDWNGLTGFQYSTKDNLGLASPNFASATIGVTPSNSAPITSSIEVAPLQYLENSGPLQITNSISVFDIDDTEIESATIQINGNYVFGQDVLSFTNTATISGTWNAATGTLVLNGTESWSNYELALRSTRYENLSNAPSSAPRTVSFTINDGELESNTLTRDINIIPVNDAPFATTDRFSIFEETVLFGNTTSNDVDPENDDLIYSVIEGPSYANTFQLNANGLFNYVPDRDFFGVDEFTYQVLDGNGGIATARVEIAVQNINDTPIVVTDQYTTIDAEPLEAVVSVLHNDVDPDNDRLNALLQIAPSHGTIVFDSDGTFTYLPNPSFVGIDRFFYVANDGTAASQPVEVTIEVKTSGVNPGDEETSENENNDEDENENGNSNEGGNPGNHPLTPDDDGRPSTNRDEKKKALNLNLTNRKDTEFLVNDLAQFQFVELDTIAGNIRELRSSIHPFNRHLPSKVIGEAIDSSDQVTRIFNSLASEKLVVWDQIDRLAQEVLETNHQFDINITLSSLTGTVTLGGILWFLRGGVLMATTLSQLPTWRMIDPLTVLESFEMEPNVDDDLGEIFRK